MDWKALRRQRINRQIEAVQAKIDLLSGKTVADVKALAAGFESPDFPKIGVPEDSWTGAPEPLDESSFGRNPDATTFNYCGWCKYAQPMLSRCNYGIESYCGLMPEEHRRMAHFNTPCELISGNQKLMDACVAHLKDELDKLENKKRELERI
ncbi:hypothetical protein IKE71_00755 [Candidatus Saccharibacteria bacterium]|nr:hypothetical protein [Candidatus Saccharibacteria bacterium]